MADSCEDGYEPSVFVKDGKFLEWLGKYCRLCSTALVE